MPPVKRRRAKQGRLGFVACIAVVALLISATGAEPRRSRSQPDPHADAPVHPHAELDVGHPVLPRSRRHGHVLRELRHQPGPVLVERPCHEPRWRRSLHEPGDRRVGLVRPGSTGSFSGTFVVPDAAHTIHSPYYLHLIAMCFWPVRPYTANTPTGWYALGTPQSLVDVGGSKFNWQGQLAYLATFGLGQIGALLDVNQQGAPRVVHAGTPTVTTTTTKPITTTSTTSTTKVPSTTTTTKKRGT